MYQEESPIAKVYNRCKERYSNLSIQYGEEKVVMGGMLIILASISVLFLVWGLSTIETNIQIGRMEESVEVQEETLISVMREAKLDEGYSLSSMIVDGFISFSSEVEAVSAFNEFVGVCSNMKEKEEVITVPKGAGEVSFATINIYMWSRSGEFLLTGNDFKEIHAILIIDDSYVYITYNAKTLSFGAAIETGRVLN